MANIDRIVNVSVSLNTTGVTEEGFSTIMVVGPHCHDLSRVLSVSSVDELVSLGFSSTDPIYIAVSDALSQTPRPAQVKVGRFQCDTVKFGMALTTDSDGNVVDSTSVKGAAYKVEIKSLDSDGNVNTETYSYTATENGEDVLNELAAQIIAGTRKDSDGNDVILSTSVADGIVTIEASEKDFSFVVGTSSNLQLRGVEESTYLDESGNDISITKNMTYITSADNDFYGIIYTSRNQADILKMADWTESHTKLFGTAIAEVGCLTSEVETDTGSKLNQGNYYRTYWFYHKDADTDYPDAAVMARCFSIEPGGETWANKKLSAITTDNLSEEQYNAVTSKCGNTFEKFRNVTITQNGMVAAGEWIDVIRFRDWLVEEIKVEEFSMLINRDKLPYTDAGIAVVENILNKVLQLGQKRGGIAPTEYDEDNNPNYGYVITVPKASSISANVKASRKLTDVKFVARLAGAIHAVSITGSLTYEALN